MAGCGVGIKKVRPDSCEGVRADGRGGYLLSHFRSIIDVVRFNFSVRNGKRWSPHAMATLSLSQSPSGFPTRCIRLRECPESDKSFTQCNNLRITSSTQGFLERLARMDCLVAKSLFCSFYSFHVLRDVSLRKGLGD